MNSVLKLLMLSQMLILVACTHTEAKRDPAYAAVRPVAVPPSPKTDGAIFDANKNVMLFEDYRARRVGDIITVKLEENTSAEKESETSVNKSNNNAITSPTILGAATAFDLPSFLPLETNGKNNLGFDLKSSHDFKGTGDSDQSNKISGNISVSVVEILPNGNMVIRGEKVMTINQGNEYVRISGMISPRDIDADNTVSSVKIANAQIAYVGDGPTNDANVMGWLGRFFISAIMPF